MTKKAEDKKTETLLNKSNVEGLVMKPCPFCGEKEDICLKAKMHRGKPLEIDGHKYWYVECLPCDAQTGKHFDGDDDIYGGRTGSERATDAWNERVS